MRNLEEYLLKYRVFSAKHLVKSTFVFSCGKNLLMVICLMLISFLTWYWTRSFPCRLFFVVAFFKESVLYMSNTRITYYVKVMREVYLSFIEALAKISHCDHGSWFLNQLLNKHHSMYHHDPLPWVEIVLFSGSCCSESCCAVLSDFSSSRRWMILGLSVHGSTDPSETKRALGVKVNS